jgi:hypothetical protein
MRPEYLRAKAQEYLRLARGLSPHKPLRLQLMHMAGVLEQRARDLEVTHRRRPPGGVKTGDAEKA